MLKLFYGLECFWFGYKAIKNRLFKLGRAHPSRGRVPASPGTRRENLVCVELQQWRKVTLGQNCSIIASTEHRDCGLKLNL